MKNFFQDESGQDLVEYALIVAAVGLALISSIAALQHGVSALYGSITGRITGIDWTVAEQR
jgi:pilus assembly protein Flp/PilA